MTVQEALEAIREVYGYEFKIDGSRIYIQPAGLQTRIFQVNYLTGARQGRSDMRVTATAIAAPSKSLAVSGHATGGRRGARQSVASVARTFSAIWCSHE